VKHILIAVRGLILRGIFMLRREELHWFYQQGCSFLFPDIWEQYLAPIPVSERHDLIQAYHRYLNSSDPEIRRVAAKAWSLWEAATCRLLPDPELIAHFTEDEFTRLLLRALKIIILFIVVFLKVTPNY
jgi:proline iminopeptidase